MTAESARRNLLLFALAITASQLLFFILAPVFGYKLKFDEALRMAEVVGPVFLGYIGAATRYLFQRQAVQTRVKSPELLAILVWGPSIIFTLITIAALVAFGVANRDSGPGMKPETLSLILAGNVALLAVSTGVLIEHLFNEHPP